MKTVGSFWQWPTTLFDYVRRGMPYNAPLSLKDEEVYGAVAYVLFLNSIIGENDPMNAQTLPKVQMPNKASMPSGQTLDHKCASASSARLQRRLCLPQIC